MFTSLGIFNLTVLSFGAGASLIVDLFLIFTLKNHRLSQYEFRALRRLLTISFIGGSLAALSELALLFYNFSAGGVVNEFSSLVLVLFFAVVVTASLTIRNIHLKTLERYQKNHSHLSDNFIEHSPGMSQTATISIITWFSIICLKAQILYGTIFSTNVSVERGYGFLLYLLAVIIGPFIVKHFKRRYR